MIKTRFTLEIDPTSLRRSFLSSRGGTIQSVTRYSARGGFRQPRPQIEVNRRLWALKLNRRPPRATRKKTTGKLAKRFHVPRGGAPGTTENEPKKVDGPAGRRDGEAAACGGLVVQISSREYRPVVHSRRIQKKKKDVFGTNSSKTNPYDIRELIAAASCVRRSHRPSARPASRPRRPPMPTPLRPSRVEHERLRGR